MYCPDCKSTLSCGCESCMKHSPNKPNKMIVHDNDDEECPVCKKRMSIHEWFNLEGKQYDEIKKSQGGEVLFSQPTFLYGTDFQLNNIELTID